MAIFSASKFPSVLQDSGKHAAELIAKNQMPDALLRLTVSRGIGLRGYSPKGADKPVLVMTLHPFPGAPASGPAPGLVMARNPPGRRPALHRVKLTPLPSACLRAKKLAHFKTANKLARVLARAEADSVGAMMALLLATPKASSSKREQ